MRPKTKEMLNKAAHILSEGMPVPGKTLATKCGLKVNSAYRIIRLLREGGMGIIPTKQGYLMADHAEKKDDVYFLRCLNGRRTSDYIALNGCINSMRKRWKGIEQNQLKQILQPFNVSRGALSTSLTILQEKSERLGI